MTRRFDTLGPAGLFPLLGACAALLSACGTGWGMAVPADVVGTSDELPVKNRSSWSGALANESFELGSYKVADVDRKWNSTRSSSLFGFDSKKTQGGYGYKLTGGSVPLVGGCATESAQKGASLGGGLEFSKLVAKLGCSCKGERGEATLTLDASTTQQFSGEVKGEGYRHRIAAITARENGRMPSRDPLGYRVDGEGPIGAVGVVKPGRVWLSKALDAQQREELACLFAGLMLYEPPKER
jgi:hypothetical protein